MAHFCVVPILINCIKLYGLENYVHVEKVRRE